MYILDVLHSIFEGLFIHLKFTIEKLQYLLQVYLSDILISLGGTSLAHTMWHVHVHQMNAYVHYIVFLKVTEQPKLKA